MLAFSTFQIVIFAINVDFAFCGIHNWSNTTSDEPETDRTLPGKRLELHILSDFCMGHMKRCFTHECNSMPLVRRGLTIFAFKCT